MKLNAFRLLAAFPGPPVFGAAAYDEPRVEASIHY
jgi:hypothetical protein